jgi:lysophospholipase L1-like esterase
LACVLVLLAKGVGLSPGSIVLSVVLLAIVGFRAVGVGAGPESRRSVTAAQLAVCWLAWVVLMVDWNAAAHSRRTPRFDPARPVACLGDSLTAYGFPETLQGSLAARVVNRGRDGITTTDAMELLPAALADNPQAVVVELGGHDFLKGYGRAKTRANLEQIIRDCRAAGAEVVLMEIPRGLVYDSFHGLERDLARQYDLELVADTPIRLLVFGSPYGPPGMWLPQERRLSDDGLHPNAQGNGLLAKYVAAALVRLYGPEVLKR